LTENQPLSTNVQCWNSRVVNNF